MKKLSLVLGALVLGFLLTSCGTSTKDKIYKDTDEFFTQKEAEIQTIDNMDDLLAFVSAMNENPELDLVDKYTDEEGNIIGLTEQDSDELIDMMMERRDAYKVIEEAKCIELTEPLVEDYENIIASLYEDYEADLPEAEEQKMAEWENLYGMIDHYYDIIPDTLYKRFLDADDVFDFMFGLGDYAEEEEGEEE